MGTFEAANASEILADLDATYRGTRRACTYIETLTESLKQPTQLQGILRLHLERKERSDGRTRCDKAKSTRNRYCSGSRRSKPEALRTNALALIRSPGDQSLSVVLPPRCSRTVESRRAHNRITKIIRRLRPIDRIHDPFHTLNHHALTRTRRAALQLRNHVARRRALPVPQHQIAKVEVTGIAVAGGGVVAGTLRRREDTARISELEIFEGHVMRIPESAAAAVWWVARGDARPGLDIRTIPHAKVDGDVPGGDILDALEDAIVLSDRANGDAQTGVELAVFDQDVGAISLGRNGIVPVVNDPVAESYVVTVDGIRAVGVEGGEVEANSLLGIGGVDVDVLQKYRRGVDDCHRPVVSDISTVRLRFFPVVE